MTQYQPGPLLSKINIPEDLRKLITDDELPQLADELRQYIIDVVSEKGGHFGASLGVVELTLALHYVYDTPYDQIVWDVGHQAYGHKILTGRREIFHTNRRYQGISGFPKRSESPYDAFGVGHSSTSISATLGMAVASKLQGNIKRKHVAVIGDGSMTAGMAFEALNHGGVENSDLLVVLNDNCMAIDLSVGALKEYLTDIATSSTYNKVRDEVWSLLGKISKFGPSAQAIAQKVETAVKSVLLKQSNLFESLNFRYFGPIDGHDVKHVAKVLKDLKEIPGPKILHCITKKGKGYKPAEEGSATVWHAPGYFNKTTGEILPSTNTKPQPPKFQDVFGHTIIELAEKNKKIMGITPAMPTGSSLKFMMDVMPDRALDVGIAEQHAVTFSAGLATQGMIPFCNIYSAFMQRAYDQVIHDVALQNLNVVFCLDRGGLAGADGPTHHGAFDLAYFRCIPNMIVAAPMDEIELRHMMFTAQQDNMGPFSIRYPRGEGSIVDWKQPMQALEIGKARKIRSGTDVALLSIGAIGTKGIKAAALLDQEKISLAHYDLRFVKPLDEKLLHEVFSKFTNIITIEDGCLKGGMGSAVLEFMSDHGYSANVIRLGIEDRFIEHGTQEELYTECGINVDDIVKAARKLFGIKKTKPSVVQIRDVNFKSYS
jgi:1-deoxy-D-xylulose-5-phosphate synthase